MTQVMILLLKLKMFKTLSMLVVLIQTLNAIGRLENQHATIIDVMIDIFFKIAKELKAVSEDNPSKQWRLQDV